MGEQPLSEKTPLWETLTAEAAAPPPEARADVRDGTVVSGERTVGAVADLRGRRAWPWVGAAGLLGLGAWGAVVLFGAGLWPRSGATADVLAGSAQPGAPVIWLDRIGGTVEVSGVTVARRGRAGGRLFVSLRGMDAEQPPTAFWGQLARADNLAPINAPWRAWPPDGHLPYTETGILELSIPPDIQWAPPGQYVILLRGTGPHGPYFLRSPEFQLPSP